MIKNKKEYHSFIAVLGYLLDGDPKKDTIEGNAIELIATLIEDYEKIHYPFPKVSAEQLEQHLKEEK